MQSEVTVSHETSRLGRGAVSRATRRGEKFSDIDLPAAPAYIAEMVVTGEGRDPRLEAIIQATARVFGVPRGEVIYGTSASGRRGRQVAGLLAYAWCETPFNELAQVLSCDRSTISAAMSRIHEELQTPSRILPITIEAIIAELGG